MGGGAGGRDSDHPTEESHERPASHHGRLYARLSGPRSATRYDKPRDALVVPRSRSIEPGVYRCIVADRTEKPEHPEHRPHLFNRQKPCAELEQLLQEVDGEMVQLDDR